MINWTIVAAVAVPVFLASVAYLIKGLLGFSNEKTAFTVQLASVKTQVAVIESKVDNTQAAVQDLRGEFRQAVAELKSEMRQYFKDERERVDRQIEGIKKQ